MRINTKLIMIICTVISADSTVAQSTESGTRTPPERFLLQGSQFSAEIFSQTGLLTNNQTQGVNGIALRAALAASESPVQLDDAYTRRTIREIPGERIDMRVNVGHPDYDNTTLLRDAVFHESALNGGNEHGVVNGIIAYKYGREDQVEAYQQLPLVAPLEALHNPDSLVDFIQ
jgi:hypothetical protein